jgi:hypothetical protein
MKGALGMGQAKVISVDAVQAMDTLLTIQREVTADGIVTPTELLRLNRAADDAHGKVINVHWRVKLLAMFTRDVQDVRNIEETTSRNGIRNGLRLLDPVTPLDAA